MESAGEVSDVIPPSNESGPTNESGTTNQPDEWPDRVPVLCTPDRKVLLRAHRGSDVEALVQQCRDPEVIRWTTVPTPEGGYGADEARWFIFDYSAGSWNSGSAEVWAIDAVRSDGGARQYCGTIELRRLDEVAAEVAFVLHPQARGHGMMSAATDLVVDHAFASGYRVIRWKAMVGNWGSRRVAAKSGFQYEGLSRSQLEHHGELRDCWVASLCDSDARESRLWPRQPVLDADQLVLRPLRSADLPRIEQSLCDPALRRWMARFPVDQCDLDAMTLLVQAWEGWIIGNAAVFGVASADEAQVLLGVVALLGIEADSGRAEAGYWLHPDARGRGVGQIALDRLVRWCRQRPDISSLLVRTAEDNHAARRLAEVSGFELFGIQSGASRSGTERVGLAHYGLLTR